MKAVFEIREIYTFKNALFLPFQMVTLSCDIIQISSIKEAEKKSKTRNMYTFSELLVEVKHSHNKSINYEKTKTNELQSNKNKKFKISK